ncbi:hypothetical protein DM02DRAFT_611715 [Periconia macrospinosa]|uniref:Uncharacterized protein n=1 Tax=Periconia macrospinosa TaxID=97972 RepID=A0A2V1E1G9_9PLEO|nr:hypothetical protein DM02DRAFT_611715 [Periconia macrospinosa]
MYSYLCSPALGYAIYLSTHHVCTAQHSTAQRSTAQHKQQLISRIHYCADSYSLTR